MMLVSLDAWYNSVGGSGASNSLEKPVALAKWHSFRQPALSFQLLSLFACVGSRPPWVTAPATWTTAVARAEAAG